MDTLAFLPMVSIFGKLLESLLSIKLRANYCQGLAPTSLGNRSLQEPMWNMGSDPTQQPCRTSSTYMQRCPSSNALLNSARNTSMRASVLNLYATISIFGKIWMCHTVSNFVVSKPLCAKALHIPPVLRNRLLQIVHVDHREHTNDSNRAQHI